MPVVLPPAPPPAPPPAASASAATLPARRYGFGDAWLGESLAEWLEVAPASVGVPCASSAHDPSVQTCRRADLDLGAGYGARELSCTFVDGRLARIAFRTSIDGFAHVTAALKAKDGAPDRVVRDTLGRTGRPHVLMTWRNGRSTIELSDPLADTVHLGVRLTLDADASRLAKAG